MSDFVIVKEANVFFHFMQMALSHANLSPPWLHWKVLLKTAHVQVP